MAQPADQARDLTGMRVALVHAHPDDEAITTGGTIAQLVRRGAEVTVVTCTLGELGEVIGEPYQGLVGGEADQLGGFRVHELHAALTALGCNGPGHAPVHLGGAGRWRDSGMVGDPGNDAERAFIRSGDEALDQLTDVLRDLRPHAVITYDADGGYGHPDHIRAHELTVAACDRLRAEVRAGSDARSDAGSDADLWATLWTVTDDDALRAGLDAVTVVPEGWTRAGFDELPSVASDFAIELSDSDVAAKAAALRAHATQVWVGDGAVNMVNPHAALGAVDASGAARGVWALSNLICQPIMPAEHYRLGTATADLAAVLAGEKDRAGGKDRAGAEDETTGAAR
ncbi:N-acetyl-1-D-myo-inositol-2-amino-2-deoxy-alpha-D-glucopyranoside deacetylase [Corynebacterium hansenii]|uniref:1D-myo-inositol 2-acetamido-2-deoxy-alpha-D-glucopyranoside deacetylase n=1 Tax=Corynebacterium hansenii TaxID=394964 RepID=A0ABV7ZKA7_9CORY|nr:N-acetyl-1-D-myo-inositol-2-amino-2-deoxy-alpha-D-glucopyranoside deacetylase [Corynebacterium hansenii]WJY99475.1 1D-myo-inositol 2-acetamido-2-deoxy-alpha-D-glucopyranoside deacetylase [Corynebacterium hansenii]